MKKKIKMSVKVKSKVKKVVVKSKKKEMVYLPVITNDNKFVKLTMDDLYNFKEQLKNKTCIVNVDEYKIKFTEQDLTSIMQALDDSRAQQIGVSLILRK